MCLCKNKVEILAVCFKNALFGYPETEIYKSFPDFVIVFTNICFLRKEKAFQNLWD